MFETVLDYSTLIRWHIHNPQSTVAFRTPNIVDLWPLTLGGLEV
jgi:hypothetical protein